MGRLLKQTHSRFPERIETPRLVLRRWGEDDRDAFVAIWADPDVAASLHPGPGYAERRFEHHLRHWDAHGFGVFAVAERESGEIAGWAGPAHPDFLPELEHEIELGWTLRRPFWGNGLATEAAAAALEAVVHALRPERIVSVIEPGNERSIAVARRLGMSDTGEVGRTAAGYELRVYATAG
jgi:RimJ/RimL family protein N-acetyltransferase